MTTDTTNHATGQLVWRCDTCRQPITPLADGYLQVDHHDIAEYRRALAEWEQRVTDANPPGALRVVSGTLLGERPNPAKWRVTCKSCDPDPEGASLYWFSLDRAATWPELTDWTAHLLEKNWLPQTNWRSVLYRVIANNPEKEHTP